MSSEELKAIQYFRENLDWFHSLEIDTDKLKTVLNLAEKRCFAYLDSDYVPKWKIECIITGIQKEYKKGKYNEYQKRIFISVEELLKSLFKEGQHDSISD